jgi:competence protein ComEC
VKPINLHKILLRMRWLLIILPLLLGITPTRSAQTSPQMTITFIDVGQGDATLIRDGAGFDILIDGGRKSAAEKVIEHLQAVGVDDLEIVIATHADRDHIGGLIELLGSGQVLVESVYYNGYPGDTLTWGEFTTAVGAAGLSLNILQYPQSLSWGNFSVQVLNPLPALVDPAQNQVSIVLMIDYAQLAVFFPADIDASIEDLLPTRTTSLAADLLKVAHHGSQYSSSPAFLQAVQPAEAIISVGANSYGHPAPDTLERLAAGEIRVWRTDLLGTITIQSNGSTYQVLPMLTLLPLITRQ